MTLLLVAGLLALVVGVSLGVLGGGGSVLLVPSLVYGVGMDEKPAIATSLLVVAATSVVGAVASFRRGRVEARTALAFAPATMVGAALGARWAAYLEGQTLLLLFAGLMLVTAVAMWRGRAEAARPREASAVLVGLVGVAVGAVTGLVGAGGGFLVVPALVLLLGLPMRQAVGTSLVVIALNASVGFAGYASHVEVDYGLAAWISALAAVGVGLGLALSPRVSAEGLRRGFAVFVLAVAGAMLALELPLAGALEGILAAVELPALLGGVLIAGAASLLMLASGRVAGISGIVGGLFGASGADARFRWLFLSGLLAGGLVLALAFPSALPSAPVASTPTLALAGLLVGYGARLGSGCTSGHGVCGLARLSPRSWVATATFIGAGMVTVTLLRGLS